MSAHGVRWKLESTVFEEKGDGYVAGFDCTNMETNAVVKITLEQKRGDPATDLISSLTALARLLHRVNNADEDDSGAVKRLN